MVRLATAVLATNDVGMLRVITSFVREEAAASNDAIKAPLLLTSSAWLLENDN